jgi:hypothetical protein
LQGSHCPQWVLPNAGGSGYYRWNLADSQWQALLHNFAEFNATEMLSIIDSAFAAFEAGTLSESILLQLIQRSSQSDQRQVLVAPLSFLQKYRRNYLSTANEPAFLQFTKGLYQPVLDRTANSLDSEQQLLHSELMRFMALSAKDPAARQRLLEKATAFTGFEWERDVEALESDLYAAALTVAIQDAGEAFLPHLMKLRTELDDPLFESASATAIGHSSHSAQLDQIHELALSDALGSRESFSLIYAAMAEPALQEQHWQWLVENFAAVINKIPEQFQRFTPRFGDSFCDTGQLEELRRLFETHGDLAIGYKRNLAQTEEKIQLCMSLRERGRALTGNLIAQ